MKKIALLVLCAACSLSHLSAQLSPAIKRIDPVNWWTGMVNNQIQLMVYGPQAATLAYHIDYPGVHLLQTTTVENPNYAFLDIVIADSAKPGTIAVKGIKGKQTVSYAYELKARTQTPKGAGLSSADLIYLIMPDRFANGDTANDRFETMADPQADRKIAYLRHGGDLQGIINHLDYLQEIGVTAVWLTPVLVNDEQLKPEAPDRMQAGYHGYHFTDHYAIDPRFGGNRAYSQFSDEVHRRGMKLVQDAVYNHISDEHWFYKDLPSKNWINLWPSYTGSSHKEQALYDPYSAAADEKVFTEGWFTSFLPDLNQRDPLLAKYLIQHAIWSTETYQLDAWRIDTYKYNDQAFMNACNAALLAEYPHIHLFGETTASRPLGLSYFVKNKVDFPFKSNLPGTLDFPLNYAILDALKQDFGWDDGVNRIYQTLAEDVVYADPMRLVTSLDNHDMDRYFSVIGEDLGKYKMGITWLLTTRGIPSLYYGTEILMKNFRNPSDAEVRLDFPGGFAGDKSNKFTAGGRTALENEAFNFVKQLSLYRKNTPALHSGHLMQYVPQNGIYVYFRYDSAKTVMVATNSTDKLATLNRNRYAQRMQGFRSARNVITGEIISDLSNISLPPKTAWVLELM